MAVKTSRATVYLQEICGLLPFPEKRQNYFVWSFHLDIKTEVCLKIRFAKNHINTHCINNVNRESVT